MRRLDPERRPLFETVSAMFSSARRRGFLPLVEHVERRDLPSAAPLVEPVPLPELTGTYQGQSGGLYGDGSNAVPTALETSAEAAVARIGPLDASGRPADHGRVGMIAIGQSTTRLIFGGFQRAVRDFPDRSPALSLVNAGQDGVVTQRWAREAGPWRVAHQKVGAAGLTDRQVQVVWFEVAEIRAWRYGDLDARIRRTASDVERIVKRIGAEFPNVKVVFLTSRPYGGYAPDGPDPEPYAYESGFGVRRAILDRAAAAPASPSAPVAVWGPYDWANGETTSVAGLNWLSTDFWDGVHPNAYGMNKAAEVMLKFFAENRLAKPWFARS